MIITQDKDSIYITADSMYSARVADIKDSAYRDLRKEFTPTISPSKDSSAKKRQPAAEKEYCAYRKKVAKRHYQKHYRYQHKR